MVVELDKFKNVTLATVNGTLKMIVDLARPLVFSLFHNKPTDKQMKVARVLQSGNLDSLRAVSEKVALLNNNQHPQRWNRPE